MSNPHCECQIAGWCARHQMNKPEHLFLLCKGLANSIDGGRKYWIAWEQGMIGATRPPDPITNPPPFCVHARPRNSIADGLHLATAGLIAASSGNHKNQQAVIDHWIPTNIEPIAPVTLATPVRHLTCHLWPVNGYGTWQWNCDHLLANAALFNGRRVVAIVESPEAASADEVKEYLKGFTDEFIVLKNNKTFREVVSWITMLERLEPYQSENDVTFSCHGKCCRHKIGVADSGHTIFSWAKAMYDTCLDWESVAPLLRTHATVGSFRKNGVTRRGGFGPWHYTGAFYWWRNRDAYKRNWRYVPNAFFGTEAWPGWLFTRAESAYLVKDNVGDLYQMDYWNTEIQPELDKIKKQL